MAAAVGSPADRDFPLMPLGQAVDMGHGPDGTPLIDPRLFDTAEFQRNPYPYYRIMRDHYPVFHDKLHNCYYVTRYQDITDCYFDALMWNTIPKGSSNGVLGNTQLELSGVEHGRRRNLYGRHLVGKALTKRIPAIERLAAEMLESWLDPAAGVAEVDPVTGRRTIEFGRAFANEFPIRVVCQVLGFPDEARGDFFYWYSSMMTGLGGSETHHQGVQARQDLEDYVEGLVEERRKRPTYLYDDAGNQITMDIISELCHSVVDGDVLSTEEITSNIALVVGGGGETTRGAILNMWYLLLQHPDQFAAVVADDAAVGRGVPRDVAAQHLDRRPAPSQQLRHRAPRRAHPGRLAGPHGRLLGQPRRADLRRAGDVRHLPARPLQRQDPPQRLPQGWASAATWPSASARTSARGRGSPTRSRCSGHASSSSTCVIPASPSTGCRRTSTG